jgi:hypothetical protein
MINEIQWKHGKQNQAIPTYYLDASGKRHSSIGELVTANFLRLNKIQFLTQALVGDSISDSEQRVDFVLINRGVYIEVIQSDALRQTMHASQAVAKQHEHRKLGWECLCINSDKFWTPTGFDIIEFCEHLRLYLLLAGIPSTAELPLAKLGYWDSSEINQLMTLEQPRLFDFLEEHGVTGLAALKSSFHFFMRTLKMREDFDEILVHLYERDKKHANKEGKATSIDK